MNLSQVYEKCIFDEMAESFDDILSNYQSGFRKGFLSQHWLVSINREMEKH